MMKKEIPDIFQKQLFERYHKIKKHFLNGLLNKNVTQKKIQDALLIRKDNLNKTDEKILENFIKTDAITSIEKVPITKYKPIVNFLTKPKPLQLRHQELVNLLAFLLDYHPRPYSEFLKNETEDAVTILPKEKLFSTDLFKHILQDKYLKHPDFNSIKINGDIDNNIGLLSMKNYYIQLSYISQKDLYNRDSLLKDEIEQSYAKVMGNRVSFSITDHSPDYITEKTLANNRIVVSGNPGVGKSTYAKWLCFTWATRFDKQGKIPIYIKLRELHFENNTFLLEYIQNNYFHEKKTQETNLKQLLNDVGNYQLILDGFDEISYKNRERLTEKIKGLKYMVLSRPYGLMNHQLSYDVSFQIDGFNSVGVANYLSSLIDNTPQKSKSKDELQILISKNKILHEFSYNPLMLSYIVLIYLTSDTYKVDLSSIESVYDLQASVFDWMLHYAKQKPKTNIDYSNNMRKKMQEFAFELQLSKKFVYTYDTDDIHYKTITNLNTIGLGSSTKLGKHQYNKWQFSFNTITFQEFLAAQYLNKSSFNKDAFVYLITDSFFWNFSVMLVGMLSKNKNTSKLLIEMLDFLYNFSKKENASYYRYSYYLLLAECSRYVVSKEVEKRSISVSIRFYKKAYFDDFWENVMLNSLVKIVYKIPYALKNEYIDYLLKEIKYTPSFEVEKSYYLSNLMDIGIEYNEKDILFALKDLIEKLLKDLNKIESKTIKIESEKHRKGSKAYDNQMNRIDEMYEKENALRNAIINLYNDLSLFSPNALEEIKDFILKIYREEATFIRALEYIITKTKLKNYNLKHFKYYNESLISCCEKISLTQEVSEQKNCFENALLLSESIFVSLNSTDTYYKIDSKLLEKSAKYLSENLTSLVSFDSVGDFYKSHLVDLCISNLILLNKPVLYDTIFNMIHEYDAEVFIKIPNKKAYYNFIVDKINTAIKKQDYKTIEKVLISIKQVVFRAFEFDKYREVLLKAFKELLHLKIKESANDDISYQIDDLLIIIANLPYTNFDKKYFIDRLVKDKSALTPFIKQKIILQRLAKDLMFYEKKYWLLFIDFLKETDWDVRSTVRLLSNKDLYLFETNHSYILKIFIKTFENKKNTNKEIYTEFGSEILFLITQILLIIKKKPDDKPKYKTIHIIGVLIKHPAILNFYNYRITDLTSIEQVTAYILYFSLNPSDEYLFFKENLYQEVSNEVGAKMAIINYILIFMENPDYGIEIHEIEKLKPILGVNFYRDLIEIMNQRLLNKNRFDPNHFNILLKS